jgi:SAM-dependent methyltransferase
VVLEDITKYLRELGYDVFGADINPNFIKECKEKFPEFKDKYFVKDMREIDFENEFDIILNWFNSFSYFSHEENKKVLKNFYNALKKDGILILHTTTAGAIINKLIHQESFEKEFIIIDEKYILIGKSLFADLIALITSIGVK